MTDNASNNPDSLSQMVELLSNLLKLLYPFPDENANSSDGRDFKTTFDSEMLNPNIITLADFKRRYQFTGLGPLAITAIEQAQRIVQATDSFEDIGLNEFHFGLILLYCQDYRGAIQQFQAARKQWAYVDKTAAVRLTYLAEGLLNQHVHAYETALKCLREAELMGQRIHLEPPAKDRKKFLQSMSDSLSIAQKVIHKALEKQTTPEEKKDPSSDGDSSQLNTESAVDENDIPAPINNLQPEHQFNTPIPDHKTKNNRLTWYRVHIRRPDPLFEDIKDLGWLLVHKPESKQEIKENSLVVIASNDLNTNASIILEPHNNGEPGFPRIYLARKEFEGPFSRTENQVTLSSEIRHIPVDIEHILGYVVGLWLEIGESGILES